MAAKVKIKPVGGNILVKPIEEETKTASGIVLPDSVSKEKKQKGEVIALGTGAKTLEGKAIPFNVEVGQTVIYKQYGPDEIEVDGEEYLIMNENDILAIVG